MIEINGPKTLVLSPNTLALVLDSLAEKPFRLAQPAIDEIIQQLKPKETKDEQPNAGGSKPAAIPDGSVSDFDPERSTRVRRNGAGTKGRHSD